MTYLIEEKDIQKLNLITQYPSILTFHEIDQEKRALDTLIPSSIFAQDAVLYAYEKINGENARIIFVGNGKEIDYMIGSKEEILYAKGDRNSISKEGIVHFLKPLTEQLAVELKGMEGLRVLYFEYYGSRLPGAEQYTSDKRQATRLLDIFSLSTNDFDSLFNKENEELNFWRENGGQTYWTCNGREEFARKYNIETVPMVAKLYGKDIPVHYKKTLEWLSEFTNTKVGIDQFGNSEGIVIRTPDRKQVVKIRFEDYEKRIYFEEYEKWKLKI